MRTRKTLAGVTAGALALGVLALSPISPASAAADPLSDGSVNNWLAGSLGFLPISSVSDLNPGPGVTPSPFPVIDTSNSNVAAKITTTAKVSVFGSRLDKDTGVNFDGYDVSPTWEDISTTGVVGFDDDTSPGPNPIDVLWIKSAANRPASVTVQLWEDIDLDGELDGSEEDTALAPVTMNFVAQSDVFSIVQTSPESVIRENGVLGFFSLPVTLNGPLLQDWDPALLGPLGAYFSDEICDETTEPDDCEAGISNWTAGSWASLNGDDNVVADDFSTPLAAFDVAAGGIWASQTGEIDVTGWFDPTGFVQWDQDGVPASLPAGFKTSSAKVQVIDRTVDMGASTITFSGTGFVPYSPGMGFVAPLSTKNVTVTVDARVEDTNRPGESLPIANTNIEVRLNAYNESDENFTVNGVDYGTGIDDVIVVKTDANGKAVLNVQIDRPAPATELSDFRLEAYFVGYEGEDVGPLGFGNAEYPEYGYAYNYVEFNAPGVVHPYRSTFTVNGKSYKGYMGGEDFYDSVVQNTNSTFTAQIIDTFGNPIKNIEVDIEDDNSSFDTDGDTDANGRVTLNIPGQANGYRDLDVDVDGGHWLNGTIVYKPQAQMTAGKITAQPRTRGWVARDFIDRPPYTLVTFLVTDSTGNPMKGVLGNVNTSRGFILDGGDLEDLDSNGLAVVNGDGSLTVAVASLTVGTANVTLTIGGKSATAKVDFSNKDAAASTLVLTAKDGSEIPTSVAPNAKVRMRASATDINGNPLEGAYVLVKVKGDARTSTGNRQIVRFTGKNGSFSFYVKARDAGSFRVIAKTDKAIDFEEFMPTGMGPIVGSYLKAKSPTILIED